MLASGVVMLSHRLVSRRIGPTHWERRDGGQKLARVTMPFVEDRDPAYSSGAVMIEGEIWRARCPREWADGVRVGDRVVVERVDGLMMLVREVSNAGT